MSFETIIDYKVPVGTASNQVLVWNPTTKLYDVSLSLSGLTLVSPDITGTVNALGSTTAFGGDLTGLRFISDTAASGLAFIFKEPDSGFAYQKVASSDIVWVAVDGIVLQEWVNTDGDLLSTIYSDLDVTGNITVGQYIGVTADTTLMELEDGLLTVNGDLEVDGIIEIPTTSSLVGQITQNGSILLHTYGASNLFLGSNSGNFTTTGSGFNVGIGSATLSSLTTGVGNVAIGDNSLTNLTTGSLNIALGQNSLLNVTTGSSNLGIGRSAYISVTTGGDNVGIGRNVGVSYASASSNNICIGNFSGGASTTVNGSTFIGFYAGTHETGSDTFILENESVASEALGRTHALMYGLFENNASGPLMRINGKLEVGNATTSQLSILTGNVRIGDTTTPTEKLEVAGNAVATGDVSGATLTAGDGFTGTGAYTNFTITAGIITAAS